MTIPFWGILIVLQIMIQNISCTTLYVCLFQNTVVQFSTGSHFHQQNTSFPICHTIVQQNHVLHCEGPELQSINPIVCLMYQCMHHERSCNLHHRLDGLLRSRTMMLSSNTLKTLILTLRVTIFTKNIFGEGAIITMEMAQLFCGLFANPLLKFVLSN